MLLILLTTLINVDPDCPSHVPRCPNQKGPVFATFRVPFFDVRYQSGRYSADSYLSYAVALRNDNANPTTKPRTVKRTFDVDTEGSCLPSQPFSQWIKPVLRGHVQFTCRSCERQVNTVDQIATNISGTINLGRILPSIRRKVGHLLCLLRSRGPT
jgi:hypothetical protein